MKDNHLNVIKSGPSEESSDCTIKVLSTRKANQKKLEAKFERLWLLDPQQFNPMRNCMQKERIERTWTLLRSFFDPSGKKIVDIGCGEGFFTRRLRDNGAQMVAVDIAENALKRLRTHDMREIRAQQEAMPQTSLADDFYDLVVCMEVIANLEKEDYRLFFAELSRVTKRNGYVLCSTPIDIYTDGAVEKLLDYARTELEIVDYCASYHALHICLKRFFQAPAKFVEGWKNPEFRQKELSQKKGFNYYWFYLNTTFIFIWLWYFLSVCLRPLLKVIKNNRSVLLWMEKITRFLWDDSGISHFIFLARRRPLFQKPIEEPIERRGKKEVWE